MNNSTPSTESDRVVPVLLVLFIGSGCSALIYEIVWFELLRQVVGASSISLAIVLTSFMGGLFLGSWGFPRWFRSAAEKKIAAAQFNLGVMYADGTGVPQDDAEAARWYARAAKQGHTDARRQLNALLERQKAESESDD